MVKKRIRTVRESLPGYLNNSLPEADRQKVDECLRQDDEARQLLQDWKQVRDVIVHQPVYLPSLAVEQRLLETIRSRHRVTYPYAHLYALGAALIILVLLWSIVRPGVVLQWSVQSEDVSTFRIYRAARGTGEYELLGELPANAGTQQYTYIDMLLLPWETYSYLVEGTRDGSALALSQTVTSSALEALPAQLMLLAASVLMGYGCVLLLRVWQESLPRRLQGV